MNIQLTDQDESNEINQKVDSTDVTMHTEMSNLWLLRKQKIVNWWWQLEFCDGVEKD